MALGCLSSSGVQVGLGGDVPGTILWWAAYGDHPNLASACFSSYLSQALNFCARVHEYPVPLFTQEMGLRFYLQELGFLRTTL